MQETELDKLIILLYFALILSYTPSAGFFHPYALILLTLTTVLLFVVLLSPRFAQSLAAPLRALTLHPSILLSAGGMVLLGWLFFQNPSPFPPGVFPWLTAPHPQGLPVAAVGMGLLLWWSWPGTRSYTLPYPTLYAVVLLNMALGIIFYGGLYQQSRGLVTVSYFLLWVSFGLTLLYLPEAAWLQKQWKGQEIVRALLRVKFPVLVIVALALRVLLIQSSPRPPIDVFVCANLGAQELLHGRNPYEALYPSPYPPAAAPADIQANIQNENQKGMWLNYYQYWPGTLISTLPGVLWGGDIRYTYLLAQLATVWLLLRLTGHLPGRSGASHRNVGEWIVILFLFHPRWSLMLEQAWTEPLLIVWVTGAAVLLQKIEGQQISTPIHRYVGQAHRQRRMEWGASLCWGMFIATKQYAALLLPLIYLLIPQGSRLVWLSLVVFTVIILPFVLWNPHEFYHDTIGLQLDPVARFDSLSLYSAWHWWLNAQMISGANFLAFGAVVLWTWRQQRRHIQSPNAVVNLLFCSALALLALFLFSRWAFLNYYSFPTALLLLAYAAQCKARQVTGDECVNR
ncbi:MAG: hypothetical protein NZT92_07660 [Abditibacteriales bacterium]|nr:hypothetical protein [Abditibacteriales bacterium]